MATSAESRALPPIIARGLDASSDFNRICGLNPQSRSFVLTMQPPTQRKNSHQTVAVERPEPPLTQPTMFPSLGYPAMRSEPRETCRDTSVFTRDGAGERRDGKRGRKRDERRDGRRNVRRDGKRDERRDGRRDERRDGRWDGRKDGKRDERRDERSDERSGVHTTNLAKDAMNS
ncbi:hypothetical protein NQZ68_024722 [Dissostichus eleginoides]|nr:hypothetical protein NQZ68_024722 [Dissostichus eleginoides]